MTYQHFLEDTEFGGGGSLRAPPKNGFGATPYFLVRSPISRRERSKSRIQRMTRLLVSRRQLVILVSDWSVWYQMVSDGISWYQLVSAGISWYQLVSAGISWYQLVSVGISWYQLVSVGISWFG
jgi:hypothetical protein